MARDVQSVGGHAAPPRPSAVAAVLSPQTGPAAVASPLERLYAAFHFTPEEMLAALPPRGHNPCRAQHGQVSVSDSGGRREPIHDLGRITCGHNPHLYARLVDGLRPAARPGPDGERGLPWDERPGPGRLPDLSGAADLRPRRSVR